MTAVSNASLPLGYERCMSKRRGQVKTSRHDATTRPALSLQSSEARDRVSPVFLQQVTACPL